uniref:Hydantoinase B/oxoprolinase domain-containing protein n=1 Tax=Callorhinchus milii TaxID=7868 RepID=A0A4W3H397_CALMI
GATELLLAPAHTPGCSGSRNLHDNLSDLRAQVAANQRGIGLVNELIDGYGLEVVQAYMAHIQNNAELAVKEMLKTFARTHRERMGTLRVGAEDYMDDGTPIKLQVTINEEEGTAVFDFTGSGPEVFGNCNAPRAITLSALIYCLRCMVGQDIPLNQGCLAPVQVRMSRGSILDPSPEAAVVGGNVLTSQRLVDVIFKAFSVCAASQPCDGHIPPSPRLGVPPLSSALGCHPARGALYNCMLLLLTNRNLLHSLGCDVRYPVVLRRFELNPGTGGQGLFCGGDGVIRELLFREKVVLSVLTERRSFRPYGMHGGEPGAPGLNLLICEDGRIINLGAKTSIPLKPGDMFRLRTPGGGGWGAKDQETPGDHHSVRKWRSEPGVTERGSVFEYRRAQEAV